MLCPQFRFRSVAVFFCAVVLSGLPLPVLDAHPTSSAEVSNHPSLLVHFHTVPAREHQGVEDSEVHVHWVSILVVANSMSEDCHLEASAQVTGLQRDGSGEVPVCVVLRQWVDDRSIALEKHFLPDHQNSPSRADSPHTTRLLL